MNTVKVMIIKGKSRFSTENGRACLLVFIYIRKKVNTLVYNRFARLRLFGKAFTDWAEQTANQ